jgi:hypothetical protein
VTGRQSLVFAFQATTCSVSVKSSETSGCLRALW